jgi:hypothetical protein
MSIIICTLHKEFDIVQIFDLQDFIFLQVSI